VFPHLTQNWLQLIAAFMSVGLEFSELLNLLGLALHTILRKKIV
jgi:hypothetical protein